MKVGIIVGRFQCHKLTEGHKTLINRVLSENERVIFFVGVYPKKPDFRNPLPFSLRKSMILDFTADYGVEIIPFYDVFNLPLWNSNLDKKIEELTSKDDEVVLYGSRDSFIFGYNGKYKTKEIEANGDCSVTELRNKVALTDFTNTDEKFRAGVIFGVMYASGNIEV